jgi:hypothetical protein
MLLQIDIGVDFLGAFNLEPDNPSPGSTDEEGACMTSGRFYLDWGVKFLIPICMAAFALLLCLAIRVQPQEVRLHAPGLRVYTYVYAHMQHGPLVATTALRSACLHADRSQRSRALLLIMQFGLFPWNLNAMQVAVATAVRIALAPAIGDMSRPTSSILYTVYVLGYAIVT